LSETDNHQGPDFESILIDFALDSWRFARTFDRVVMNLDAGQTNRFASQCNYFIKRLKEGLEKANLRLVDASGQEFEPGMAITPLNLEDFAADDRLLIDHMVEPIIMGPQGLLRAGTAILRRVES
jgi:hypothetical protein